MSVRVARTAFVAYFVVYAIVLTFPGVLPFNRIRPLVFGLPFIFFWTLLWIGLAFVVFWSVDRVEAAVERETD